VGKAGEEMTNREIVYDIFNDPRWCVSQSWLEDKILELLDAKDRLYAAAWEECEAWRRDVAEGRAKPWGQILKSPIAHDAARKEAGL